MITVLFASAVVYKSAKQGTAGGSVTYSAGSFSSSSITMAPGLSGGNPNMSVAINYATDTGDTGVFDFAYNPTTTDFTDALSAALTAKFPGVSFTITYS